MWSPTTRPWTVLWFCSIVVVSSRSITVIDPYVDCLQGTEPVNYCCVYWLWDSVSSVYQYHPVAVTLSAVATDARYQVLFGSYNLYLINYSDACAVFCGSPMADWKSSASKTKSFQLASIDRGNARIYIIAAFHCFAMTICSQFRCWSKSANKMLFAIANGICYKFMSSVLPNRCENSSHACSWYKPKEWRCNYKYFFSITSICNRSFIGCYLWK